MIHQQGTITKKLSHNKIIEKIEYSTGKKFNRALSSANQLRFGGKGSLSVNIENNCWFDFETEEGGGLRNLLLDSQDLYKKPSLKFECQKKEIDYQKTVDQIINGASNCEEHPYLTRKHLKPNGFFIDRNGTLLIPKYFNGDVHPCNLEMRNDSWPHPRQVKGAPSKGAYNFISNSESPAILLSEGAADMLSLAYATNITSYCSFSSGNLLSVAQYIRSKTKNFILIAADNDTAGLSAAKKCLNSIHQLAIWHTPCKCCNDPNDFYIQHGDQALKKQIFEALAYAKHN